jgi:subtilase family serine protease
LQVGPDLVVTEVSAPRSVRHGQPFTATVKVCNQGSEPATTYYTWPWLELYLSTDASLSMPGGGSPPPTDQRLIGSVDVPPLDPGQCVTREVSAHASLPPDAQGDGAYYLGAIVDVSQVLSEADETNNAYVSGLMGVGFRPDLVVTEVRGPASVRPGAPFTATLTVCNQGTEFTSNTPSVDLYLSMDDSLTPLPTDPGTPPPTDQRMIGSVQLSPLGAGQCVTRSVQAWAWLPPDAQGDGAYYLGAVVDPFRVELELREDNNAHVPGLMGVGYRPDLVVTEVRGPASARPGDPFTATVTVCNQGTVSTPSWYSQTHVDLYLSTDTTLTPPSTSGPSTPPMDQRMVGTVQLPPLNAGQCVTRSVNAHAQPPQDPLPRQAYYLGAIVDPFQGEPELREDNNITVGDLMGVGYRPDLVVTEVTAPASVLGGQHFTATVRVCNQGTESTGWYGQTQVELYLSMDTTLTAPNPMGPSTPPTDQRMIGSAPVPPLSAGQCVSQVVNVSAYPPPDALGDGTAFHLGAIVDPHQSELELREDNNTFIGGLLGVGHRPDLVVTRLSGPASVRGGESFTATVTVCNQGTEPTGWYGGPHVELYLSMDTALTSHGSSGPGMPMPTDQRMVGSVDLPPLHPGQCATRSVSAYAQPPPDATVESAFYLGAIIDAFEQLPELREDNNTFVGGLLGVGYRPDLVVTQVTGPASVRPGDAFTASVTVCNQGTEPTSGYGQPQVELYLSTTSALVFPGPGLPPSAMDQQRLIGGAPLAPLMAGQCATLSVPVSAHVPPAAYDVRAFHLGAIVDAHRSEMELREDNNVTVAGLVGVGHQSDLVVTEVSGPASVRRGMPFTASVKVCNQGTEPGSSYGNVQVELYLSTDTTLTPPGPMAPPPLDQSMVGSLLVPPLAPGQCETLSVQATANPPPEAPWEGAVYLGAIVDAYRSEWELREDNNSTAAGLMGVGDRADLVVTQVSAPATVREGDPFTAAVTVCNQGTEPVNSYGAPTLELYISMDTTLTFPVSSGPWTPMPTDQRMVGSVQVSPLAPGQCETLNVQAWGYRPPAAQGPGSFFLGALVDAHQSLLELREDNNARADASLELTW